MTDAARALTKDDLIAGLCALGLAPGMHVVVHSSLSRLGRVADGGRGAVDGAHTIIDALEEVVTPAGTLVMPTFSPRVQFFLEAFHARHARNGVTDWRGTPEELAAELTAIALASRFRRFPFDSGSNFWARMIIESVPKWPGWTIEPATQDVAPGTPLRVGCTTPPYPPENLRPNRMPTIVGIIPETYWHRPEARRSEQYSGSFTTWGALTDRIIERHDNCSTVVFEDHPLYRMREIGGKILLLGVDHGRNSTIHVAEEAAVRSRGLNIGHEFLGHFMTVDEPLSRRGGQKIGRIGAATVRLVDTRTLYATVDDILAAKLASGEIAPAA